MIHDFVVEHHLRKENTTLNVSLPGDVVVSPWDKVLREHGWAPERRNDLDDDDLVISYVSTTFFNIPVLKCID